MQMVKRGMTKIIILGIQECNYMKACAPVRLRLVNTRSEN